jgi:uncharacterized membrane protein (DUF485 family)
MEELQNNSKSDEPDDLNQIINSPEFKDLVRKRTSISVILTIIICVVYFTFLLIIAFDKELLANKIGENITLGLPVGVGLIIFTWLITGFYVYWSNHSYDKNVLNLKKKFSQERSTQ